MPLQEPIKDELVKVKFTKGWDKSHDSHMEGECFKLEDRDSKVSVWVEPHHGTFNMIMEDGCFEGQRAS